MSALVSEAVLAFATIFDQSIIIFCRHWRIKILNDNTSDRTGAAGASPMGPGPTERDPGPGRDSTWDPLNALGPTEPGPTEHQTETTGQGGYRRELLYINHNHISVRLLTRYIIHSITVL